eukprot:jgi/Mesvir1/19559/Mv07031-RA.1
MLSPSPSSDHITIYEILGLRGVGAQVVGAIPVLERLRLRETCRAFLSAVDESLEDVSELFWEDVADAAGRPGGLDWLVHKCPNLQTLSIWSRTDLRPDDRDAHMQKMGGRLVGPLMATQSLLGIPQCRRLRSLNMAGSADVRDDFLTALAGSCRELESLDVSYCRVTDAGITELSLHCPGLTDLAARGLSRVSNASIKQVAMCCGQLQRLDIAETAVTDDGVSAVTQHCAHLRHLAIGGCQEVTDAGMLAVAANCPHLWSLDVSGLQHITNASILAIARHCRQLRGLNLSGCRGSFDGGITAVAEYCTQLERLEMCHVRMRWATMREVAHNFTRLRHLNAQGCCGFGDDVISVLAANCPQLRHLSVSNGPYVTDYGIVLLAQRCCQLEHLSILGCDRVTDAGITAVAQQCPRLRHLDICGCCNVTDASVALVGTHCRELEELKVSARAGRVTDAGLIVVARNCARLRSLTIVGDQIAWGDVFKHCGRLEHLDVTAASTSLGECMEAIGRYCTRLLSFVAGNCRLSDEYLAELLAGPGAARLQHIDLSFCDTLTDKSLIAIAHACPQLRMLNLWAAIQQHLTDVGISAIAQGCPRLTYLNIVGAAGIEGALSMLGPAKCEVVT